MVDEISEISRNRHMAQCHKGDSGASVCGGHGTRQAGREMAKIVTAVAEGRIETGNTFRIC